MTNGEYPHPRVIALSRGLAEKFKLKKKGRFNYKFGTIIVLRGTDGYDGEYVFKDLMPVKWRHNRVDVWQPSKKHCDIFGFKKNVRIYVKK